jgi:hypothetical protein
VLIHSATIYSPYLAGNILLATQCYVTSGDILVSFKTFPGKGEKKHGSNFGNFKEIFNDTLAVL